MNGDFGESEFFRRLEPCMADDNDTVGIDHDRLAKPELVDREDDGINGVVIDARIVLVRLDSIKRPHFDLHVCPSKARE